MRLDESKIRQIIRQTIAQRLSEAAGSVEVTNQILKAIEPEVQGLWDDAVKNPAKYIDSKLSISLLTAVKLVVSDSRRGGLLAMSTQLQSGMTPKQLGAQYAAAAADDVKKSGGPVQPAELAAMEKFGAALATIAKGAIDKYQGTRAAAQKSGTAGKQMKTWDDYISLSSDGNKARDVRAAFTAYAGKKGGTGTGDDSFPAFVRWYNTAKRENGGKDFGLDAAVKMLSAKPKGGAAASKTVTESRRRLNEGDSYKLIDLLKDTCEEFNSKYKSKSLRARPGKYGGTACVVVGGKGWRQVVGETDAAFKTGAALKSELDSIMKGLRVSKLGLGTPRAVKKPDPAVISAKCDSAINVKIKDDYRELDTPLVDSDPGVLSNIEDYSLYAVTVSSSR